MRRAEWLEIGYVARAHGLKGEVGIRTYDPGSHALFDVSHVLLAPKGQPGRRLELEEVRAAKDQMLVRVSGVGNRNEAEGLVGLAVYVAREELPPPAEGEFFQGDLVGLDAFAPDGTHLGKVEEVWNTGPVPNLVIRDGTRELMVPFSDDFVPTVDIEGGRVVVRPPEMVE